MGWRRTQPLAYVKDDMRPIKHWAVLAALAGLLAACGGTDAPVTGSSDYSANPNDVTNNRDASLTSVLAAVNNQTPRVTADGCDGTADQPVYVSLWVGDYTSLALYGPSFSNDIQRVAAMADRQQVYYATTPQYQALITNLSSADVAGDTSLDLPKGTGEVWYEFYCSIGTLSAGKVTL